MPPPADGLPESSLIIAPNKNAGNKKRRRPAFRPGQQRVTKSTAATKKKAIDKTIENEAPSQTKQAEVSEETPPVNEKLSLESSEQQDQSITTEGAPPAESAPEKPVDSAEKNAAPEAPLEDSAAANPKPPPVSNASKKAPSAILQGAGNKNAPTTTTIKKKAGAAKAISPMPRGGRKRKSTGLVVGASRIIDYQKKAQKGHHPGQTAPEHDGQMPPLRLPVSAATAAAKTSATAAPPPLQQHKQQQQQQQQHIPTAREGDNKLGQFCSKFRMKLDKTQGGGDKKKKEQDAKDKKNKNQSEASQKEEEQPSAGPVVQIIDGEIVLQESSMVVERGGASVLVSSNRGRNAEEDEYAVVEEDADMAVVGASYNSFVSRKNKPQHWTIEETKLFFEALRQVGTDFMLMSEFYPNRTRKQLKKKYQREYTKNPKLVELALDPSQQKPMDLTIFEVDPKEVQEQVKVQKQKDLEEAAKAKKVAEEKKQEEQDLPGDNGKNEDKENGVEMVLEEENEQQEEVPKPVDGKAPAHATAEGGEEERVEPLWPDANNELGFDAEVVVEEDPIMMGEFHHPGDDEFDDIPAHDDAMEEEDQHHQEQQDETDASAEAAAKSPAPKPPSPPAAKEPALSLVPTAKNKKPSIRKPKFRSARPLKKKK